MRIVEGKFRGNVSLWSHGIESVFMCLLTVDLSHLHYYVSFFYRVTSDLPHHTVFIGRLIRFITLGQKQAKKNPVSNVAFFCSFNMSQILIFKALSPSCSDPPPTSLSRAYAVPRACIQACLPTHLLEKGFSSLSTSDSCLSLKV